MKTRLREEMLPLMINIENDEFYDTIMVPEGDLQFEDEEEAGDYRERG